MKVGIIGKGLAGIITALTWKTIAPDVEIEIYHDKEIPPVPVGAGSIPNFLELLKAVNKVEPSFWVDWRNNSLKAIPKTGIMYEGWGVKGHDWYHPFPLGDLAMHFDPLEFQDSIINSGMFNVTEKHIESYDDLDVDYIYDCAGFPKNYDDYYNIRNPLNKVILGNLPVCTDIDDCSLTRTVATPDGWCFVIPLRDRTSVGYLYNDNYTTDEEALCNFKEQFGVEEIVKTISFKNYCAKNPVIDDRIFLNGNKYFFIEPMEATSVTEYYRWAGNTASYILKNTPVPLHDMILESRWGVMENANFILYHYSYGSKYDTPFWDYAKSLKADDMRMDSLIQRSYTANTWRGMDEIPYGHFKLQSILQCHYELIGESYHERRAEKGG
tara:strand:- start:1652 stop:2800 length:1149 start_codon:yes stop_codon:yes gene_type:complete